MGSAELKSNSAQPKAHLTGHEIVVSGGKRVKLQGTCTATTTKRLSQPLKVGESREAKVLASLSSGRSDPSNPSKHCVA
jgi:hypothetical protein